MKNVFLFCSGYKLMKSDIRNIIITNVKYKAALGTLSAK